MHLYSVLRAQFAADPAFNAFFLIDKMLAVRSVFNGPRRAILGADGAADAVIIYFEPDQVFALSGGALPGNMRFVFVTEETQR